MDRQKVTPFLWFEGQAEEAVNFYASVFKDVKIIEMTRYGEDTPGQPGTVMTVEFELFGQRFVALNGGPEFKFTPAVSFMVRCQSQEEVDRYWDQLLEGGQADNCGWLRDRYGLSWQIVPDELYTLLNQPDREKADRVMQAMLRMVKLDVYELRRASEQESAPQP